MNPLVNPDVNKTAAIALGGVLVLVGFLGFVMNPILGIFTTSLVHNLVHAASGVALLAVAFAEEGRHARTGLLALGVVYGVVTLLGFANPITLEQTLGMGFINDADNYLHLLLAGALFAVPLVWKNDAGVPRPARA